MSRSRHDDNDDDSDLDWLTECLSSPLRKKIKLTKCASQDSSTAGSVDQEKAQSTIEYMLGLLDEPGTAASSSELGQTSGSGLASLTSTDAEVQLSSNVLNSQHDEQQPSRDELLVLAQSNCLATALDAMQKLLEARLAGKNNISIMLQR